MRLTPLPALLLASLWLASLGLAFWLGNRAREPVSPEAARRMLAEATVQRVKGLRVHRDAPGNVRFVLEERANGEPGVRERLVAALEIVNRSAREVAVFEVTSQLTAQGVDEALALVNELPFGPDRDGLLQSLLYRWGEVEPNDALDYAARIPGAQRREAAVTGVLTGWATADPAAAWAWLQANPSGQRVDLRLHGVLAGIAQAGDPGAATDLIEGIRDPDRRFETASLLVSEFLYSGYRERVLQWVETLPPGPFREAGEEAIITHLGQFDPEAALRWLEGRGDGRGAASATPSQRLSLAAAWAQNDPRAAADWAFALGGSDPSDSGGATSADPLARVVENWAAFDRDAVGRWLNEQEPSDRLDPAVEAFARQVVGVDPEGAMAWAAVVQDPDRRAGLMREVASLWRDEDAGGWRSFLASDALTNADRALLEQTPDEVGGTLSLSSEGLLVTGGVVALLSDGIGDASLEVAVEPPAGLNTAYGEPGAGAEGQGGLGEAIDLVLADPALSDQDKQTLLRAIVRLAAGTTEPETPAGPRGRR